MTVFYKEIHLYSKKIPTFHNVTSAAQNALKASGITNGICVVYSRHTSCGILIQEFCHDLGDDGTEFLMEDMLDMFEGIIPTCASFGQYNHPGPEHIAFAEGNGELAEWSLNTDAHLRTVLLGRSESIPVKDGALELGNFGSIYLADLDQTRERERVVTVQIVGE